MYGTKEIDYGLYNHVNKAIEPVVGKLNEIEIIDS